MNKSACQGVLLDLDGTLIDGFTPIVIALNQTLEKYGLAKMSPRAIRRHTGVGDGGIATLFGDDWPAARRQFLELHDRIHLETIAPLPGASELLLWLKEHGIPAGIVTNKAQARAEEQISHLGWQEYIAAIIGADEDRPGKPNPEPVHRLCRQLGVLAAHTLLVGDGPVDMQAAKAAGSTGIGITASFSTGEMAEAGARHCFRDLCTLLAWLRTG